MRARTAPLASGSACRDEPPAPGREGMGKEATDAGWRSGSLRFSLECAARMHTQLQRTLFFPLLTCKHRAEAMAVLPPRCTSATATGWTSPAVQSRCSSAPDLKISCECLFPPYHPPAAGTRRSHGNATHSHLYIHISIYIFCLHLGLYLPTYPCTHDS